MKQRTELAIRRQSSGKHSIRTAKRKKKAKTKKRG